MSDTPSTPDRLRGGVDAPSFPGGLHDADASALLHASLNATDPAVNR